MDETSRAEHFTPGVDWKALLAICSEILDRRLVPLHHNFLAIATLNCILEDIIALIGHMPTATFRSIHELLPQLWRCDSGKLVDYTSAVWYPQTRLRTTKLHCQWRSRQPCSGLSTNCNEILDQFSPPWRNHLLLFRSPWLLIPF